MGCARCALSGSPSTRSSVPLPGQRRHLAGREIELPELMGAGVGEEQLAADSTRCPRPKQAPPHGRLAAGCSTGPRSPVPASVLTDAGRKLDPADGVIAGIGDVDAVRIAGQPLRAVEGAVLAAEVEKAGLAAAVASHFPAGIVAQDNLMMAAVGDRPELRPARTSQAA